MANIDPNEDEYTSKKIEEAWEIFEEALSKGGYWEKLQDVSKAKMEILLMAEEILQIDAEARTREDIERVVRKYAVRMPAKMNEKRIQESIDLMCKFFNIQT
jgi:hypothetical protein